MKRQKTVGAYRQAQAAAMKMREASKYIESVTSTLKNDLGAGISGLQSSIGDLRQLVADKTKWMANRKLLKRRASVTRSMLEKSCEICVFYSKRRKMTCVA